MAKRALESNVEPETMEELVEKVESQAATIRDLKDRLQTQSDNCRELRTLYVSRCERLEDQCKEEAAKHRTEVNMLKKLLEGEFCYLFLP